MSRLRKYVPIMRVQLVREARTTLPSDYIQSPRTAHALLWPLYRDFPCEVMSVLCLNAANSPIAWSIATAGILNSSLVHPREIFQRAILANAASIITAHNHPSGRTEPSGEDIRIWKQLTEAGKIIGIPTVDHLIITESSYYSAAEGGLI